MYFQLIVFSIFVGFSQAKDTQIPCKDQIITLSRETLFIFPNVTTDYPLSCNIQFIVPKYFLPLTLLDKSSLKNGDHITITQSTLFQGTTSYFPSSEMSNTSMIYLAPVNFNLTIDIVQPHPFIMTISASDGTPSNINPAIKVTPDLAYIHDLQAMAGNSTTIVDCGGSCDKTYSVKAIKAGTTYETMTSRILVYDGDAFLASASDLGNSYTPILYARNISIVNANPSPLFGLTFIISPGYAWNETSISIVQPPSLADTTTISAKTGQKVVQEISQYNLWSMDQVQLTNINFKVNGTLEIYAGCVTSRQESRRIATIRPEDVDNYKGLSYFGQCRTYILSEGEVQLMKTAGLTQSYRQPIGHRGVFMSYEYPLPNPDDQYPRVTLIQPLEQAYCMSVDYEFPFIAKDVSLTATGYYYQAGTKNQTITSSMNGGTLTINGTYQQLWSTNVPKGSEGFLIRYTVKESSVYCSCFGFNTFGIFVYVLIYLMSQ